MARERTTHAARATSASLPLLTGIPCESRGAAFEGLYYSVYV
jgi:hypothetical protein